MHVSHPDRQQRAAGRGAAQRGDRGVERGVVRRRPPNHSGAMRSPAVAAGAGAPPPPAMDPRGDPLPFIALDSQYVQAVRDTADLEPDATVQRCVGFGGASVGE